MITSILIVVIAFLNIAFVWGKALPGISDMVTGPNANATTEAAAEKIALKVIKSTLTTLFVMVVALLVVIMMLGQAS